MSSYTPLDIEEFKKKYADNTLFIVIIVLLGIVTVGILSYIGYTLFTKYL